MKSKIVKYLTIVFLIVNAICGASFLCGFFREMIDQWHRSYYQEHNYPLIQERFIYIDKNGKPIFRHYT